jgi:hypothetical protein
MMMLRKTFVACALLIALSASVSWSEGAASHTFTKYSEAKKLMKVAQTPKEYADLAAYFDQRAKMFEQNYQEEKLDLARLQSARFRAKNYPTMVMSAQMGSEHDRVQAEKCSSLAKTYHQRAGNSLDQIAQSADQH